MVRHRSLFKARVCGGTFEVTKGKTPARVKRSPQRVSRRVKKPAPKRPRAPPSRGRTAADTSKPRSAWQRYRNSVVANAFVASIMGIVVLGGVLRLAEIIVRPSPPPSVTEILLARIDESERSAIGDLPSGFRMSDEIRRALIEASRDVGIDARYLVAVAAKESGFDPAARADRSTAAGLFQFTQPTWLRVVKVFGAKHGLAAEADQIVVDDNGGVAMPDAAARMRLLERRDDARLSAIMAAELGLDNQARLERFLGRSATPAEIYIAHFLGVSQAATIIKAARATPRLPGTRLLPAAAASNPGVFGSAANAASVSAIVARIDAYFALQLPRL
jgi:hypothetical protein